MLRRIEKLYKLLTSEQRKKLLLLQVLVILMAFAEIAGVAAIGSFMAVVGDVSRLQGDGFLAQLYQLSGFETHSQFLFWLGIAVLVVLSGGSAISMYTIWCLSMYAQKIGAELSVRLYKHYMNQPWLFHASGSSSQLTNRIAQECGRITNQIIQPVMQMNAKIVLVFLMSIAIFILNPLVAFAGLSIFTILYFLLFKTVRQRLAQNGKTISKVNQQRFKLMSEGFGGIKDTLLLGRQAEFNQRFQRASFDFGYAQGTTRALSQTPRYLMELVAFGSVIFLVLYLLAVYDGNLGDILPVLSVYALAGFKLLPSFQQIYSSLAQVKGNLSSFDSLEKDLLNSRGVLRSELEGSSKKLSPRINIALSNVHFNYPGKVDNVLNGLNIDIPVNQVIGLVGMSGSGKSTAIDVLLGLIKPQNGQLKVDGKPLSDEQVRAWQNTVGFVPQSIFLADASIKENIAFGIPSENIDHRQVLNAVKMAHLDELVDQLPMGLDTRVGERGIQLSGGQRQRIGIARALYDDAEVLVLDEATSALDGITEKMVIDAIHDFAGKKTIVMIAHRLSTVKACDSIYLLDKGRVIDQGQYDVLAERNRQFQKMAKHS